MIAQISLPETYINTLSYESVFKSCWAENSSEVEHINEAEPLMTSINLAEHLVKLAQYPLKRNCSRAVAHYVCTPTQTTHQFLYQPSC